MLRFIRRPWRAKTPTQSSERGVGQRVNLMRPVERTDVRSLRGPKVMQQNCQFAGHGHDGLVLRLFASPGCKMKSPLSQRRVSTMWSQNVVRALDQQTSQIRVASLGDAELRIAFTGLAAFRSQTKVATDVSTASESTLIAERQDNASAAMWPTRWMVIMACVST